MCLIDQIENTMQVHSLLILLSSLLGADTSIPELLSILPIKANSILQILSFFDIFDHFCSWVFIRIILSNVIEGEFSSQNDKSAFCVISLVRMRGK